MPFIDVSVISDVLVPAFGTTNADFRGIKVRLTSYAVREDHGFAPNPHFGVLTLACCKPKIRASARIGDWILGIHSNRIGANRVCFLGKVSEAMSFDEYFNSPSYQAKKTPHPRFGDNIYRLGPNGSLVQEENPAHGAEQFEHDISVDRVLACAEYWYFGRLAPHLPDQLASVVKRGPGHKNVLDVQKIAEVLSWAEGYPTGKQGEPLGMPSRRSL